MCTCFFSPFDSPGLPEGLYSSIRTFWNLEASPNYTPLWGCFGRITKATQTKQQLHHVYQSKQNTNKVCNQSETSKKKHVPPFGNIIEPPVPLALTVSTQLPLARFHLHLLIVIAASSPPHQATSVQPWKGRQLGNDQCDKAPEFYPTYQEWEVQKFYHVGEKSIIFRLFFLFTMSG